MKFPTLPIRLWTAFAAVLVSAGCARPAFEASWRQTLDNADGGLLRVWSIADRSDSLFLRRRAEPVTARMYAAEEFGRLCEGLLTTVRNPLNEGVGIAAPQVGIGLRVIAVQRFDLPGEPFGIYVNPEIVRRMGPAVSGPEGCLSVPDRYGDVARPQQIEIRYRDRRFVPHREVVSGYTAVIFQHEVDHLDGILFIDRMEAVLP